MTCIVHVVLPKLPRACVLSVNGVNKVAPELDVELWTRSERGAWSARAMAYCFSLLLVSTRGVAVVVQSPQDKVVDVDPDCASPVRRVHLRVVLPVVAAGGG